MNLGTKLDYSDLQDFVKKQKLTGTEKIRIAFRKSAFSEIEYLKFVFQNNSLYATMNKEPEDGDSNLDNINDILDVIKKADEASDTRYCSKYNIFETYKKISFGLLRKSTYSFSSNGYWVKQILFIDGVVVLDGVFE